MKKEIQLRLSPGQVDDLNALRDRIARKAELSGKEFQYRIRRKSIDARKRPVKIILFVDVFVNEPVPELVPAHSYPDIRNSSPVLIVGAGPAGLFAALKLIDRGLKPIILERGKKVRDRRRDLAKLNRSHIVNPQSNYCFGEGGAGTYSDGKLYTRSHKRGNIRSILETFVRHGAEQNILIDAHPHIGTNKLPGIIEKIRHTIMQSGGEVCFNAQVTDLSISKSRITGAVTASGDSYEAKSLILATGHSARDVFELLNKKGIRIEPKDYALGVRVEHPQSLINRIQYHRDPRMDLLPPASYSLVSQTKAGSVYSFCMCPGGIIAPCATEAGEIVTNGWSPSRRNNPFANSGIVVSTDAADWTEYKDRGPLAGLAYQRKVEQVACQKAGNSQTAPAQRLVDFVAGRKSTNLPGCSYFPGVKSVDLREVLPERIAEALRLGLEDFSKKMKGFLHQDAIILAPESRTSSPVRIPRDKISLQHPDIQGLYPCGEGAGYAGGIVSAALDGQRIAEAVFNTLD